jgi:ABC-type transport system substrate-binding protein
MFNRRVSVVLVSALLLLAACTSDPVATEPPATAVPTPTVEPTASVSEPPFERAAWPAGGSACETEGYTGRIGRIAAVNARTVRFTLCAPDGAFLARIADPALGILDSATIERLAEDPAAARSLAGTGPYRIDRWTAGEDAILVAAGEPAPASPAPTIVLRWAADPTQRTFELQSATVDGIDAPGRLDLERIATQPELAVVPRSGLATVFLAFGDEDAFDKVRVRRAIAASLDRAALAASAFPAGSAAATHLVPCVVPGGCAGEAWYAFNAPAAAAELAAAGFDLDGSYTIHVPDRPLAGLPNPAAVAEAIAMQLRDNLDLEIAIDVMTARSFAAAVAGGTLEGLYLSSSSSSVADPVAYLDPLFRAGLKTTTAARGKEVRAALAGAAATAEAEVRRKALGQVNDAIRDAVPLIPLVTPGSVVAFRADVDGVATSPLATDPLGAATPGDRSQLVFMGIGEPAGAYCGDQRSADALRVCALVTEPLYAFAPGTLRPEPRLAERCTPDAAAVVWTCTLRAGITFHDGTRLDAGDVLATYVAQWDASAPLRAARPEATFAAWAALFGGTLGVAPD